MTLTAHQVREACALLGWKSAMLVRRAKVSYAAALRAKTDNGIIALPPADVWAIRTALERAGVRFVWDAEGRPTAELRLKTASRILATRSHRSRVST